MPSPCDAPGAPRREVRLRREKLTIERILAWADAHHAAHGDWPRTESGRVDQSPRDTWVAVNAALKAGKRGLPGGTSLACLLVEHRGEEVNARRRRLTLQQVLAWADAHHAATGRWPYSSSGAIAGTPGLKWHTIDHALRHGTRGLPGGTSLARLLAAEGRSRRSRRSWRCADEPGPSIDQVLTWADAYFAAHGSWPKPSSGPVAGVPDLSWQSISTALLRGLRGLPPGTPLRRFFREYRPSSALLLTRKTILSWADAHHGAHGIWPIASSGPIPQAPGLNWSIIDDLLRRGTLYLPPGGSLVQLIRRYHSGKSSPHSPRRQAPHPDAE